MTRENERTKIILRIEKLRRKPIENANLIKKWERKLRNLDEQD